MKERRYRDGRDVALLQDVNTAAISTTDGCGFILRGDIPHRLFNGNKLYDPAEVLTIWADPNGVAGWAMPSPRHRGYDAQVRPDLRTGLFEPVGTHSDHRRRGLGKALLLFTMKAMAAAGMKYATVVNEGTNDVSRALYASVGFAPCHLLDG